MSRVLYAPKETYTGTGSLDTYTFDFKITADTQLLVIEVDDSGVETQRVLGDDVTYLTSVTFDAVAGAGTVVLAANLATDYNLIFLLADDAPTQPYEFRNKTSFTLRRFEDALDLVSGAVQRLTYRGKQAIRIHDLDDEETFDAQLPPGVATTNNKVLIINATGTGMDFGPTAGDISNAEGYANAAAASAAAALVSENAAAADLVLTNADVVSTNADVVLTGLDVVATNADVVLTNADVITAAASEAAALISETNAGLSEVATAADLVLTNADVVLTGLDVVSTNADVVSTNADVVTTNADVVLTGLDVVAAAASAVANTPTVVVLQAIGAGAQIALTASKNDLFLRVGGDGAARTANVDVFSTTPANDIRVALIGTSDTNTLTITYTDAAGGCLVNGPSVVLGLNEIVNFVYDSAIDRYLELGRNF